MYVLLLLRLRRVSFSKGFLECRAKLVVTIETAFQLHGTEVTGEAHLTEYFEPLSILWILLGKLTLAARRSPSELFFGHDTKLLFQRDGPV